jgi:flagellar basal-body rod protein FlgB
VPSLDSIFGIHEQALFIRERRAQVLSANLANADTPNYKAMDVDFGAALKRAQDGLNSTGLTRTHAQHFEGHLLGMGSADSTLKYRIPTQNSLDGNTVETDVERAQFTENTLRYQATLEFLNSRIKSIQQAIKGE